MPTNNHIKIIDKSHEINSTNPVDNPTTDKSNDSSLCPKHADEEKQQQCKTCAECSPYIRYQDLSPSAMAYIEFKKILTEPCRLWLNIKEGDGVCYVKFSRLVFEEVSVVDRSLKITLSSIHTARLFFDFIEDQYKNLVEQMDEEDHECLILPLLDCSILDSNNIAIHSLFLESIFNQMNAELDIAKRHYSNNI